MPTLLLDMSYNNRALYGYCDFAEFISLRCSVVRCNQRDRFRSEILADFETAQHLNADMRP